MTEPSKPSLSQFGLDTVLQVLGVLLRYFHEIPHIHLNILISVISILSSYILMAQVSQPYANHFRPAAEGVCSIGILVCVLFLNVFTAVEELWEGLQTVKGLLLVAFHGCFMQLLWLKEHESSCC